MLTQDNAASQLRTASTGSSRGLHNPRGACQGGGAEQGEEEVDCVGKPVAKKQHIKSFPMGPAQHEQFHFSWPFISSIMRSPSSSWIALCLTELSPRKQLHASSHAASSSSTSTITSTSRRLRRADSRREQSVLVSNQHRADS